MVFRFKDNITYVMRAWYQPFLLCIIVDGIGYLLKKEINSEYFILSYDRTVIKDYINNQYKGNTETIKDIIESFNSIFEDDPIKK